MSREEVTVTKICYRVPGLTLTIEGDKSWLWIDAAASGVPISIARLKELVAEITE